MDLTGTAGSRPGPVEGPGRLAIKERPMGVGMSVNREAVEQVARQVAPEGATLEHLGTGGFASTFKVVPAGGEEAFALKAVDADRSEPERVERELSALQRVSHPNVVSYRDTGTVNLGGVDYRWLAMDFVEGRPLAAVLREGQTFSLAEAVALVRQAVDGAAALWSADTAHRDLSKSNLLLTPDGRLVIVDLGMARHLDDETITNLPTPGTPGWMSPEQVGPEPQHGDWRSDQFVLGLIAYRLVTGVDPLRCRNGQEAWFAPYQQTPRPPRELVPTVPSALSDLIMKMLEKAPHRRWLRPAALLTEIDQVAATLAIADSLSPVTPRFYFALGDAVGHIRTQGFIADLAPDGILVEPRSQGRVTEVCGLEGLPAGMVIVDPRTHLARSPEQHRPEYYKKLPFGERPLLTGFADAAERRAFCEEVLDFQVGYTPAAVMAPYFYAGNGERSWIQESLNCALETQQLLEARAGERGGLMEPVWTSVAVSSSWLSQPAQRDALLTLLTSQPIDTLQLMVNTNQATFAPVGDAGVLTGLVDVLQVMREADVPVILARRASEGLLGLALGATGWATGVSGVQMNMDPHPEADTMARQGQPRIYVPQLLTYVTAATYVQFAAARPDIMGLGTAPGRALLTRNPSLEDVRGDDRYLLWQHNMLAMRHQAALLAGAPQETRIEAMRTWVNVAQSFFGQLPAPAGPGESSAFLAAWENVL